MTMRDDFLFKDFNRCPDGKSGLSLKGFTLIEISLALCITAIIIAMLSVVLNTGLRSYRQGRDVLEITRTGQLVLGQMTREMAGAMVQENVIPFVGNNNVYFMAPVDNSSDVDLCEVGYNLVGNTLKRHFVAYGDADYEYPSPVDYGESEVEFCTNVKSGSFALRYYNGSTDTWQDNWDAGDNNDENLPERVEVVITVQGKYGSPPQERTFTTWIYLPNSTNNP